MLNFTSNKKYSKMLMSHIEYRLRDVIPNKLWKTADQVQISQEIFKSTWTWIDHLLRKQNSRYKIAIRKEENWRIDPNEAGEKQYTKLRNRQNLGRNKTAEHN